MYCDPTRILDKLPGAYPQSFADKYPDAEAEQITSLWATKVEAEIAFYSRYVDDAIGKKYPRQGTYKFPAWNADPATPAVISEICFYLSYAELISFYQPVVSGTEDEEQRSLRDVAEQRLKEIQDGTIVIAIEDEVVSSGAKIVSRTNLMTDCAFRSFAR